MRGTKYVLKKPVSREQKKGELVLRASIARGERKVGNQDRGVNWVCEKKDLAPSPGFGSWATGSGETGPHRTGPWSEPSQGPRRERERLACWSPGLGVRVRTPGESELRAASCTGEGGAGLIAADLYSCRLLFQALFISP